MADLNSRATEKSTGKITQIVGAVLDLKFSDRLPEINEAVKVPLKDGG